MGRLLSYSGISTKIRAMQSKLISESEIQEMLQFTSVSHAAAWLKRTPEYAKAWADLDENSLHRGQIEKLLKASIFKDFSKIYQFANPEQRKFLDLYSRRYEIRVLKEIMTNLFDHKSTDAVDVSPYCDFFRRHSKLDLDRLTACTTMDEFINALKGNEFYVPLSRIQNHDTALLFDYGMALDLYYFSMIWNVRKKLFSGKDLEQITTAYGEKFDMLNLQLLSNQVFSVSPLRMEFMMLNTIQMRMINIPNPIAITNTAFSLPTSGTSIIWFIGFSHMALSTSSKPKKLPYINPKKTENTPAQLMIPARSIFLVL